MTANPVFAGRRQNRQGLLGEGQAKAASSLPVHVTATRLGRARGEGRRHVPQGTAKASGAIYVEFPKGHPRITGRVE